MKLQFKVLLLCLAFAIRLSAVNYNEVEITPTTNTLTQARPALNALLPADFISSVFDGSGKPTMDRIYILMNIPAGMTSYEITDPLPRIVLTMAGASLNDGFNTSTESPKFTLRAGQDVCLSYKKSGSKYVLEALPFDPTTKALEEVNTPDNTTEKVYITGSTAGKLSAEMPEKVTMLMPSYLNSMRQSFSDIFVQYIHSMAGSTLPDFTFNPNCEGFFQFTGGESTNLHIFTDNLQMKVKDKQTDFLGSVIATNAQINLMGIDGPRDDNYSTYTNAELSAMSVTNVSYFDENQIRSFSTEQIQLIATKMSADQCSWLTPGQVLGLCNISDIVLAIGHENEIGTTLYSIFGDPQKALNAANVINNENLMNAIGAQLQPLLSASSTIDMIGFLFGGADLSLVIPKIFSSMVEGAASPFAFKSNSTKIDGMAFNVHIHSKGTNTITGGAAGEFKNTGTEMGMLAGLVSSSPSITTMVNDLAVMFEAMVHFCSASFAVRPSADVLQSEDDSNYEYTCTRLLFDDVWVDGTTHTNGIMQMPVEGKELDAPSIDIGNHNGKVEFNGGQYRFHTPVSTRTVNMFYVATMAICYREFNVNMPLAGNRKYRGIGTSVGWGPDHNRTDSYRNVIFYDGTFATYSAEAWKSDDRAALYGAEYKIDAVANGWYEHYTDLRLPYNTSVLGGTFPEDTYVRRCDAAAEQGAKPVYIYISNPSDPTSPQFITQLCERKELDVPVDLALPNDKLKPNGTVKVTNENRQMLTVNTSTTATQQVEYGTQSLTPDANDKVFVYVTGDCKVERDYIRNYVTALAPFGEKHMSTEMLSMGGNVEVQSLYQNKYPQKNSYLLYTQLGYYTYNYAGVNLGGLFRTLKEEFQIDRAEHHNFKPGTTSTSTNASGQNIMNTTDKNGVVFSEITNNDSYIIENGIYSMLPIRSDAWFMLSMPYDVANIYVLETTNETVNTSWNESQWEEYFQRQGAADGDMAQTLVTSVLPDIFSGRGSGIRKPLPEILNTLTNKNTKLTKLEHYNGTNFTTANFYLNVLQPDQDNNLWLLEKDQKKYGEKWKPAPRETTPTFLSEKIEDPDCTDWYDCDEIEVVLPYVDQDGNRQAQQTVVMKKGNIYSLYFPGGTNYFWSNKYLIFEGYGPQRIQGKSAHSAYASNVSGSLSYPAENYMALQGNTTFGNFDISCSDSKPVFVTEKTTDGGSYPTGIIDYSFVKYSDKSIQRVLPTEVYMVSSNNAAVRAAMPSLNGGTTELEGVPTLSSQQPSLVAYSENGIHLQAFEDQNIRVFSADGRTIWSGLVKAGTTTFLPATTGLYIIQGQQTTIKLIN